MCTERIYQETKEVAALDVEGDGTEAPLPTAALAERGLSWETAEREGHLHCRESRVCRVCARATEVRMRPGRWTPGSITLVMLLGALCGATAYRLIEGPELVKLAPVYVAARAPITGYALWHRATHAGDDTTRAVCPGCGSGDLVRLETATGVRCPDCGAADVRYRVRAYSR